MNVIGIVAGQTAFAALKSDRAVVFWGMSAAESKIFPDKLLVNVAKIRSNGKAFAALKLQRWYSCDLGMRQMVTPPGDALCGLCAKWILPIRPVIHLWQSW